jgi:hypothetical protein
MALFMVKTTDYVTSPNNPNRIQWLMNIYINKRPKDEELQWDYPNLTPTNFFLINELIRFLFQNAQHKFWSRQFSS